LLIAVIAALSMGDDVFKVFTPVEHEIREAESLKFSVTEEGIAPIELHKAVREVVSLTFPKGKERHIVETDYWTFFCRLHDPVGISCERKKTPPPISEDNISGITALVTHMKEEAEIKGDFFVVFTVAPTDESFRLFRMARERLWEQRIRVGWAPFDPRKGLAFGGGGGMKIVPQN
jgi:hypothetical protein